MDRESRDAPDQQYLLVGINASDAGDEPGDEEVEETREYSTNDHKDHPGGTRWIVLAAICLIMTCISYSFDLPSALHQPLKDHMKDRSEGEFEFEFNLLYSVYSIPNVIIPFISGIWIDRLGPSNCLPLFLFINLLGQGTFAFGTFRKSWRTMLLGRIVYGLGGESAYVACSTLLSEWFGGRELALAFGISIGMASLGSVINDWISPVIADSRGTSSAMWFGSGVNTFGLVLAIFLFCLDSRHEKNQRRRATTGTTNNELTYPLLAENPKAGIEGTPTSPPESLTESTVSSPLNSAAGSLKTVSSLFWLLALSCLLVYGCIVPFNSVASGILLERNYFKTPPDDCQLRFPGECTAGTLAIRPNPATDSNGQTCPGLDFAPVLPTSLNISRLELAYDNSSLTHVEVNCEDSFWRDGCTKDYCDTLSEATLTADEVMSIPYLICAVLSPFLGGVIDRFGRRAMLATLAPAILIAVHTTLATSNASPIGPLIWQGFSCALISAVLWPSVPLTVPKSLTGTAFGIMSSMQNTGLVVFPLVVAAIHNRSNGQYMPFVEIFFAGCASLGTLVGIYLNLVDRRTGNKLNSVSGEGDLPSEETLSSSPSLVEITAEEPIISEII
jgi:MFS family permease